jgi:hypothetical protein
MEKLIGREKEIKVLREAFEGDEPQFLAVYYGIVQNKYSIGLVQNDITLDALFERR